MERTNVYSYDNDVWLGWFDFDKAVCLAKYQAGDPYISYTWVYLTASGKLVREDSNNSGGSTRYSDCGEKTAIKLIIEAGTNKGGKWLEENKDKVEQFII